jgi:hypothetical protein
VPTTPPSETNDLVSVRLDVPAELADQLMRLQQSNPDGLRRVLAYGVTRRAVFDNMFRDLQGSASRPA